MVQKDNSREKREFQHLCLSERGAIKVLTKEGYGISEIARKIGRNKSTVSRELKRGTTTQKNSDLSERKEYFPETGEAVYKKNRTRSRNALKIGECAEFIKFADTQVKSGWSPDGVVGRAKTSGEWANKPIVCTKTLYNYIDKGLMTTKNIDLALKVRRKPKRKRVKKNKIVLGESIEKRAKTVESREEFGHWEIDSVIGKRADKTAVMTLVERKTRDQIAVKLNGRESNFVDDEVIRIYSEYGEIADKVFKSITADNGHEFAGLSDALKGLVNVYFCHPYSSFEKGTNERHNGLLRRFVKKGQSIDAMPPELIEMAAVWNNNLPRKILGYRIPAEAFADELRKISEASV